MLRAGILLLSLGWVILTGLSMQEPAQARPGPAAVGPLAEVDGTQEICTPGDQDPYVYRPERLQVLKPCVRITGTVDELEIEPDGDVHFRVRLDEPYRGLLVEGNKAEGGDLVVEPVCYVLPLHADALYLCASNPNRLQNLPQVNDHVWMEGRYVLDLGHLVWAELHPLYRWGKLGQ